MHQKGSRSAVYVRLGIADFAQSRQDLRDDFVVGFHELDQVARVLDIFISEFNFSHEPRIGLSQHSMPIPRDNFPLTQSLIREVPDVLFVPLVSILMLEIQQVSEALLVRKPVKRPSQSVERSRKGKVVV